MLIGSIINGEERKETNRKTLEVKNPYNQEETVATIALGTAEDLEEATEQSSAAFHHTMRDMPAHERGDILRKAADLLEERKNDFAHTITAEAGKPVKHSQAEVQRSVQLLRFAAEHAKNITGEVVPMDAAKGGEKRMGFVTKKPLGVVGAITPFNFPLNLSLHKLAPAIAAGNTIVFKPAEKTPVSAYKLVKLLHEAGLPEGALNLVMGTGAEIGEPLVKHPKIAKISFTGSMAVGKSIQKNAGFKKITLELGSNAPNIIFNDASIDQAVQKLVNGSFAFSGQACISAQRIYVQKNIFAEFLEAFKQQTELLKVGDPSDESIDIGPMISEKEAKRIKQWIDEAVTGGARIVTGGERNGTTVTPTVLVDVHKDMSVIADEVFAPLVSVIPFETEEEVIEAANDSIFGLQAGVFTKDINRAMRLADHLETGGVWINDSSTYRQDNYPYGGVKQSGVGKEGVKYAIEDMLEAKFVGINLEE